MYDLGQKLYKNWFIDFKLTDNAEFKNSELGKIPKNWSVGHIDDKILTTIIKSGVNKFEGEKKYVATADASDMNITNYTNITYDSKPSRANMTPISNSVWFAKMENSNKNILVDKYMNNILNNFIFSTGFMGIECKNDSLYYIWNYINSNYFIDIKNKLSTGTLMAGISNNTIPSAKYVIPDNNTLKKFNNIEEKINMKIYNNNLENEKLSKLRDTLLPKLMNGEIDLENIEI